jgi:hypothetical protein
MYWSKASKYAVCCTAELGVAPIISLFQQWIPSGPRQGHTQIGTP